MAVVNFADLADMVIKTRGTYGDDARQAALINRMRTVQKNGDETHNNIMKSYAARKLKQQQEQEAALGSVSAATPGGHFEGDGHVHESTVGSLNPNFQKALDALISAAPGRGVSVGSGYRSPAEQAVLYKRYKAGVKGQAPAAPPGKSNHNHGLAADLKYSSPAVRNWVHQNAARFGLRFPMSYEPWHIEPVNIRRR